MLVSSIANKRPVAANTLIVGMTMKIAGEYDDGHLVLLPAHRPDGVVQDGRQGDQEQKGKDEPQLAQPEIVPANAASAGEQALMY